MQSCIADLNRDGWAARTSRENYISFYDDKGRLLIDAPKEILKPRLEEQVQIITAELEQKKWALQRAQELIAEVEMD